MHLIVQPPTVGGFAFLGSAAAKVAPNVNPTVTLTTDIDATIIAFSGASATQVTSPMTCAVNGSAMDVVSTSSNIRAFRLDVTAGTHTLLTSGGTSWRTLIGLAYTRLGTTTATTGTATSGTPTVGTAATGFFIAGFGQQYALAGTPDSPATLRGRSTTTDNQAASAIVAADSDTSPITLGGGTGRWDAISISVAPI